MECDCSWSRTIKPPEVEAGGDATGVAVGGVGASTGRLAFGHGAAPFAGWAQRCEGTPGRGRSPKRRVTCDAENKTNGRRTSSDRSSARRQRIYTYGERPSKKCCGREVRNRGAVYAQAPVDRVALRIIWRKASRCCCQLCGSRLTFTPCDRFSGYWRCYPSGFRSVGSGISCGRYGGASPAPNVTKAVIGPGL
jgi:hypothetical protein